MRHTSRLPGHHHQAQDMSLSLKSPWKSCSLPTSDIGGFNSSLQSTISIGNDEKIDCKYTASMSTLLNYAKFVVLPQGATGSFCIVIVSTAQSLIRQEAF